MRASVSISWEEAGCCRVCVDEIIDCVARLLIAPLKTASEPFHVADLAAWEKEREFYLFFEDQPQRAKLVGPELRVRDEEGRDSFLWRCLDAIFSARTPSDSGVASGSVDWPPQEGRVYVAGRFTHSEADGILTPLPDRSTSRGRGSIQVLRIDRLDPVKDRLKQLYSDALTAGGDHGPRDQG